LARGHAERLADRRAIEAVVGDVHAVGEESVHEWSEFTSSLAERLQLLQRLRPVLMQETRERTVREEAAARLTARAVVGLVVRVNDPLHGRAAVGTRLAVAAVHRHVGTERG